jgi:hypothetical protein
VYEATQLDLDRRVALKVFARGPVFTRSPEHSNVVAVYSAGASPHGEYVAMQLVPGGRTLADRLGRSPIRSRDARTLLGDVGAALDAAHAAGVVHGAVAANEVLIDPAGRALLSGFRGEGDATSDRVAFAELVRRCGGRPGSPLSSSASGVVAGAFPQRRRAPYVIALAAAAAVAAYVLAFPQREQSPPHVLPGAAVLGSTLPSSSVESLDCMGEPVSGGSPACTVVQTTLSGRAVVPRQPGVIRRWTVRGAKGDLALEVLRRHGRAYFTVAHTPDSTVPDGGVHTLPAYLPVRPGDLVGLEVAPGAAVGVRRVARGTTTVRWFGPLVYDVRPPERGAGTGFDHELLLRVEYVPGVDWRVDGELRGSAASSAPAGRVVRRFVVRAGQQLAVARIGRRVVVDLFNGARRVSRLRLSDADAAGKPAAIEIRRIRLGRPIVRVSWENADDVVTHEYVVGERVLTPLD